MLVALFLFYKFVADIIAVRLGWRVLLWATDHIGEANNMIGGIIMTELSTIQKREKLNRVFSVDQPGPGGARHEYLIASDAGLMEPKETKIQFQCGARKEEGSIHGALDSDLLEIVRDRLKSFQAGPFSSRENACALTHIEEALMWMNRRVEDRIERNVLGTMNK